MSRARYGGVKPGRIPAIVAAIGAGVAVITCAVSGPLAAGIVVFFTGAAIVAGVIARWS